MLFKFKVILFFVLTKIEFLVIKPKKSFHKKYYLCPFK